VRPLVPFLLLAAAGAAGLSGVMLLLAAMVLLTLGLEALLEWNHRRRDRRFRGSSVEEILGWLE
jgi:Na+/H+-dicarboxylate symporter